MHRLLRPLIAVLALTLAVGVLAACGDDSPKQQSAAQLLEKTFGGGSKSLKSGKLGLTIAFAGTTNGKSAVSLTGPFQSNGDKQLPSFDLSAGITGQGQTFTAGATSVDGKGYITVAGTSYVLDDKTFDEFKKGYESSQASTTTSKKPTKEDEAALSKLGIDPRRWLVSPKITGTTDVGGTKTTHIETGLDLGALLADGNAILQKADVTGVTNARTKQIAKGLTKAQVAEAEKSVQNVKVDVFTGEKDTTLRRMIIAFDLNSAGAKSVLGTDHGRVTIDLTITDLNQPQTITAPENPQPFSGLEEQLTDVTGGGSASGSGDGTGDGSSSTDSGTGAEGAAGDTVSADASKYLSCLQKAGSDLEKVQKCASLVGQ